jgi:hypothetical protein
LAQRCRGDANRLDYVIHVVKEGMVPIDFEVGHSNADAEVYGEMADHPSRTMVAE